MPRRTLCNLVTGDELPSDALMARLEHMRARQAPGYNKWDQATMPRWLRHMRNERHVYDDEICEILEKRIQELQLSSEEIEHAANSLSPPTVQVESASECLRALESSSRAGKHEEKKVTYDAVSVADVPVMDVLGGIPDPLPLQDQDQDPPLRERRATGNGLYGLCVQHDSRGQPHIPPSPTTFPPEAGQRLYGHRTRPTEAAMAEVYGDVMGGGVQEYDRVNLPYSALIALPACLAEGTRISPGAAERLQCIAGTTAGCTSLKSAGTAHEARAAFVSADEPVETAGKEHFWGGVEHDDHGFTPGVCVESFPQGIRTILIGTVEVQCTGDAFMTEYSGQLDLDPRPGLICLSPASTHESTASAYILYGSGHVAEDDTDLTFKKHETAIISSEHDFRPGIHELHYHTALGDSVDVRDMYERKYNCDNLLISDGVGMRTAAVDSSITAFEPPDDNNGAAKGGRTSTISHVLTTLLQTKRFQSTPQNVCWSALARGRWVNRTTDCNGRVRVRLRQKYLDSLDPAA